MVQADGLMWPGCKVWIVAPHADDEALGCGGLLAQAKRVGAEVYVLVVTLAGYAPLSAGTACSHAARTLEMQAALRAVHATGSDVLFGHGDNHCLLDSVPLKTLVDWLETGSPYSFHRLQPNIVLLPSAQHSHQDHRRVHEAMMVVLRTPPNGDVAVRWVLEYEVPGTGLPGVGTFDPNFYLQLTEEDVREKCRLFECYRSQVAEEPHMRSLHAIRTQAAFRGMQTGGYFAEAYRVVRCHFAAPRVHLHQNGHTAAERMFSMAKTEVVAANSKKMT
ncbi:MAG: PIG-L family deacetylase [bacterium]|nr:PIG-L family deacetylase [bacterium]